MNIPNLTLPITMPPDFNWIAVLKDLIAGAPLSAEEHTRLSVMSGAWPACACGQLCQNLPRNAMGAPQDGKLYCLGLTFNNYINGQMWKQALQTFYKIEERTMDLLERQICKTDK